MRPDQAKASIIETRLEFRCRVRNNEEVSSPKVWEDPSLYVAFHSMHRDERRPRMLRAPALVLEVVGVAPRQSSEVSRSVVALEPSFVELPS